MRGVAVPAGEHTVEFRFKPPVKSLYVTLAAVAAGMLLLGLLLLPRPATETPAGAPPGA